MGRGVFAPVVVLLLGVLLEWLLTSAVCAQSLGEEYQLPIAVAELNSPAQDFAPAWNAAEQRLYFTSTRSGKARFYTAAYRGNGRFAPPREAKALNFFEHQSYLTFATPHQAYFSAFWLAERQPYLNIFEVQQQNGEWQNPQQLQFLKAEAFTSHPTTANGGKVLVFASDRPGGTGGVDLWITRQAENGVWEPPRPLTELNSPGNEITPFLLSEDTLIFASDGFGGQGGYDLFLTVFFEGRWLPPVPLTVLNSEYNESDCIVLPDRTLLFASDRPGGKGGLDFYVAIPIKKLPPLPPLQCQLQFVPPSLTIEHIREIKVHPLLPYVFFRQNQATLPTEWYQVLTAEQAARFDTAALGADVTNVYRQLLNIVGARLHRYPEARLKITGFSSRDEDDRRALAQRRAEAVAQYLQTVWGIAPQRLQVQAGDRPSNPSNPAYPEGREENRRVELSSEHPAVFAPLRLAQRRYVLEPQRVICQFALHPGAESIRWQFQLQTPAATVLYDTAGTHLPSSLSLALTPMLDSLRRWQTCRGILRVVDSLGRQTRCEQALPIAVLEITYQHHLQAETYEYSLVLFDYDQAQLSDRHRKQLEHIAVQIPQNARIVVRGYTDKVGEEEYNYRLAAQRAQAVAQYLRMLLPAAEIYVEPIGETDLVDNRTPFGRFYSRTVQILVQMPQKKRQGE